MAPEHHKSRGFTLLEVLVAFSILALSLGVLFQIFSSGLRNLRVAEAYTTATALAESKLAAIGVEEPFVEGKENGRFDDGFRWRVEVRRYEPEDLPTTAISAVQPYEVVVTVSWGERGEERSVSLTTLRLAPLE